jgi:uncharacterized membrane protein YqjE
VADQQLQDRPLGELVERLAEQTRTLVRQEMRLATVELKEKSRHAGIGVGAIGAAALVALFGAACLVACLVLALATVLDAWAAALIVGVALLAVAGVMAAAGKKQVDEAVPPTPERTAETVKADVEEVKSRLGRS